MLTAIATPIVSRKYELKIFSNKSLELLISIIRIMTFKTKVQLDKCLESFLVVGDRSETNKEE